MFNWTKVFTLGREIHFLPPLFLLIAISIFLMGCASSNVTRTVSANIDMGVRNSNTLVDNTTGFNIGDNIENASQRTRGAVLGAAVGAVAGAVSTSVGIGILPATAVGAVLGASYGAYVDANTTLRDQLVNRGVVVVILGDQILISVPSARLFNPLTATIRPQAYSTLYMITCLLNKFNKILVRVSGFTGDTGSATISNQLSKLQAERVSKFLMESGLNARLIYAEGFGCTRLVQNKNTCWDSDNYRIEITTEKLQNCC